jgi:hypothetical protein
MTTVKIALDPRTFHVEGFWYRGWGRARSAASNHARGTPTPVTEIPSKLPSGGVALADGSIVLTPWTSTQRSAMSAHGAIAAALVFANKAKTYMRHALKAELTMPGTIPRRPSLARSYSTKDHVPVWVVTFTSPKPIDVGTAGTLYVTHYSVAVNAVSGKFVLGFFER